MKLHLDISPKIKKRKCNNLNMFVCLLLLFFVIILWPPNPAAPSNLLAMLIGSQRQYAKAAFFPSHLYSAWYHYCCVPRKDNDMYIYSTWLTCLTGSSPSLLPQTLSSFFVSLSSSQQTWSICYLSPNLLCFLSQWFINSVLLSISKDTEAKREEWQERRDGRDKKILKQFMKSSVEHCHSACLCR